MTGRYSEWQCCFCEWEINSTSSRPWMRSACAISLLNGQAHLSDVDFSEGRCNYIDDKWLERPDSQVAHLVHSRCWEFFTRRFNYDDCDLKKLFGTLKGIPLGHTHRFSQSDDQSYGPWHPFTTGFTRMGAPLPNNARKLVVRESDAVILANPTDPFSSLPAEIMKEIADWTDMADYLNLRLASRVMASLFHTQIFWRHRFDIHRERGFLNCLVEEDIERGRLGKANWHQIYYKTKPARMLKQESRYSCQRILAKYRFFLRLSWIREICVRRKIPYMPLAEEQRVTTNSCWHTVNGLFPTGWNHWIPKKPHECPLTELIILPDAFVKIGIWVFQTPTRTSIAGMEFITDNKEPNKSFGYRIPGKQCVVDIGSREQLRGFKLSMQLDGIYALRVCTSGVKSASEQTLELHPSGWVGSPEGLGKYRESSEICSVVSNKEIFAIHAGFDDCMLVSLAIGTCLGVAAETTQ